jgi:hypothetical protein
MPIPVVISDDKCTRSGMPIPVVIVGSGVVESINGQTGDVTLDGNNIYTDASEATPITLNQALEQTNNVLAGVQSLTLTGALLTRVIGGTTEVSKSLFDQSTVFVAGKTLIYDANGTGGVYTGDKDSGTIIVQTQSISPIGSDEPTLLANVATKAALPATQSAAQAAFGRTVHLNDYARVLADETQGGATVEYYIAALSSDADPVITWGNPVIINTSDYQAQSTAADAGKLLVGGPTAGTFGTSIDPATFPTKDYVDNAKITTTAPAASATQDTGSTETITAKVQRVENNIADIYNKIPSGNIKTFTDGYGGSGTFTRRYTLHNCYALTSISGSGKLNTGGSAGQRWVDNGTAQQGNANYTVSIGTLNSDWVITLTCNGTAVGSTTWYTVISGIYSTVDIS